MNGEIINTEIVSVETNTETTNILDNTEKAMILVSSIKDLQYGDIIPHENLAQMIDETYGTSHYRSLITKAKKILENQYGIFLQSVHGEGYKIVKPDDTTDVSLGHYKRGFKAMNKGYKALKNAPISQMTAEGRERYRKVADRAELLNASMQGVHVELKTLARKPHPMAVENVGRR